jgi:hypothetical protein
MVEGKTFGYCFPQCPQGLYRKTLYSNETEFIHNLNGTVRQLVYDNFTMLNTCHFCPQNTTGCIYDEFNNRAFPYRCAPGFSYNKYQAKCL